MRKTEKVYETSTREQEGKKTKSRRDTEKDRQVMLRKAWKETSDNQTRGRKKRRKSRKGRER